MKEKIISNLNEMIKDKQNEEMRDIFKNVQELDMFVQRVQDYRRIKDKLKITDDGFTRTENSYFCDQEVEESLLKGMKIQSHLNNISDYID